MELARPVATRSRGCGLALPGAPKWNQIEFRAFGFII
jgi:hypothetical protein